ASRENYCANVNIVEMVTVILCPFPGITVTFFVIMWLVYPLAPACKECHPYPSSPGTGDGCMENDLVILQEKVRWNMNTEGRIELTLQEEKLIRLIRTIGYGEVHIFVKESKPIRVEEIKKSIRLD
ncbi:MAG: DUF2292 domain-containing protein, partial [Faecousia sp.]